MKDNGQALPARVYDASKALTCRCGDTTGGWQRRAARAPAQIRTGLAEQEFNVGKGDRQRITSAELADLRRARRGLIRRPGASGIVSRRGDCYTSYRALLSGRTPAITFQSTEFIALFPGRYARYSGYPEKWQVRK
ncbi:hypothetical protein B1H41_17600 [Xanthomonas vasicola pv. vasculorum]|nr:hypothetical protein B1H32_16855 [Xanthomonas vasicola pv. vasculorum]OWF58797.1 hypothetical protein B1H41_17600 [Xanthomonas vasicola pv. vasculorum]PDM34896.1 hypothetical protein CQW50_08165 [Xanthomonas vasicola pv. vasculorum]